MTRKLSAKEIENLLDFIVPEPTIPADTAEFIAQQLKNQFIEQLKDELVYPEIIPELKKELLKQYRRSIIQAGESVGIICAQSIGEKQTQSTLNTFHKAGMSEKTTTTGVPRFKELVNATKNPKMVNHTIFFRRNHETITDIRRAVNHKIAGFTLSDIAETMRVEMFKSDESWYDSYKILFDDKFSEYEHCISIKLNMEKLLEYNLTMKQIVNKIESEYIDLHCVFSPASLGQLDIFVDTTNIELPKHRLLFVDSENAVEIYMEECVLPALEKMYICGIPGISEIFFAKKDAVWTVDTNGFISKHCDTFRELLALPEVDYTKTLSNNVHDIYSVFGIEAARQFLIEEFSETMGHDVNVCHTKLLCDRMTHNGIISPITRYTLKTDSSGPIGKASFEESLDNFLKAGVQGQREPTRGVSASIICGKRASMGTGMIDVLINIAELPVAERRKSSGRKSRELFEQRFPPTEHAKKDRKKFTRKHTTRENLGSGAGIYGRTISPVEETSVEETKNEVVFEV